MANKLNYNKCTKRELRRCITWTKKILKLSDWKININISSDPRDCYGDIELEACYYEATVNIYIGNCKEGDISPLQVLMHELIHISTLGKNSLNPGHSEFVSDTFEYPMICLYLIQE